MADSDFVTGMRLSSQEIDVLGKYVEMMEQATKDKLGFADSGAVAFTPGALLVVAVAKFVYDVYQDYGKVALSARDLQSHFKSVANELAELESVDKGSLSLDTYAKFRKDLMEAKRHA